MASVLLEKSKRCLTCKKEVIIDYRETRQIMGKEFLVGYCPSCGDLTDITEAIIHERQQDS